MFKCLKVYPSIFRNKEETRNTWSTHGLSWSAIFFQTAALRFKSEGEQKMFKLLFANKKPSSVRAPPPPEQGSSHPWEWALGAAGCYVCEVLVDSRPRAPSPWRRPRRWEPSSRPADRELAFEAGGPQCPSPAGSWCSPWRRRRWCFIVLAPGASRRGRVADGNQQYWKSQKPGSAWRACKVKTYRSLAAHNQIICTLCSCSHINSELTHQCCKVLH